MIDVIEVMIMQRRTAIKMLKTRKILEQMGEQIKLARLRRKLPLNLVTEEQVLVVRQ